MKIPNIEHPILNDYICLNPFNRLEIYGDAVHCCCNGWNDTKIAHPEKLNDMYNGKIIKNIQESVLDGSFKYCNINTCPFLSNLINNGIPSGDVVKKENVNIEELYDRKGKLSIKLNIDNSCNLECKSCRSKHYIADDGESLYINSLLKNIINEFKNDVKFLHISGSADPFISRTFRNFLYDYNEDFFPNLETIYLQTNGQLLNEMRWNKMKNVHKFIKTIEISIDAGKGSTYEIIRKNGKWTRLLENLKFINTIPTLETVVYSFVVQDTNYKEMGDFIDLMSNISVNKNYHISFNGITNWGTYTDEEFKVKQIWDEEHPEFGQFLIELNKSFNRHNTSFSFFEIVNKYKLKGIMSLI